MKAMILAAGLGTRLRPLTQETPKPLLPVGGRPMIHYALLLLRRYGITEVFVNIHHHKAKLIQELGDGSQLGMEIRYSHEATLLGTGGGVKNLERDLSGGTFLLMNGDVLTDLNLDKVIEFHQRKKAAVTMVLRSDPDLDRYGAIAIDSTNRIRQIVGEAPWNGERLTKLIFCGIHVCEPRIFQYIPKGVCFSIIDAYREMLRGDEKLFGYVMRGYWRDLGTPERYAQVNEEIMKGKIRLSYMRASSL